MCDTYVGICRDAIGHGRQMHFLFSYSIPMARKPNRMTRVNSAARQAWLRNRYRFNENGKLMPPARMRTFHERHRRSFTQTLSSDANVSQPSLNYSTIFKAWAKRLTYLNVALFVAHDIFKIFSKPLSTS